MRKHDRPRQNVFRSTTDDITIRGTASQIAAKYEELGGEADRDKDPVRAHRLWQAADHYRRLGKENHVTE